MAAEDHGRSVFNILHALFDDFTESESNKLVEQYDANGTFSWWNTGRVPTKADIDNLFQETFDKVNFPLCLRISSKPSFFS